MTAGRRRLGVLAIAICTAGAVVAASLGSMAYFHFGDPQYTCASCHEMNGIHSDWSASAHRTLHCRNCHGGSLTLDLHALQSHLRRVTQHFSHVIESEQIKLTDVQVLAVHTACADCHPQAYAEWQASRHTTTYSRIFLHPEHNQNERVDDDCLRCHGMFFDGEVGDLVTPLDKIGPWALKDAGKEAHPAIPCLACHQVHTPADGAQPPHFYDRGGRLYQPATHLATARIRETDGSLAKVSLDPRQRLCQQCHAPSASAAHRRGTSDDRTPAGVHGGLSCLDCHSMHTTSARASCASCHPANSHCGLDVEKMDTSFLSPDSKHNIHSVACTDCHVQGVPHTAGGK